MQKLILSLACCLLVGYCFPQNSDAGADTLKPEKSVPPQKINEPALPASRAELSIYPNPAKNKVTLSVKGFEPGMAFVKITDTKGKLVREERRLLTNGNEDIIMFLMLQPGIYFIIVSEKGKVSRKKLVML